MIPKLSCEAYKACVYKAGDLIAIFNDIIYIPESIEKYRIPHEIASYVELKLRADMLTEEESKQAKQEEKAAYDKGLADAWEAAKKIAATPKNGGLSVEQIAEIFGSGIDHILNVCKPAEAIEKIKAYEEERTKIKVGDEVFMNFDPNETGIVTHIYSERRIQIMWADGTSGEYDTTSHKKTGRHFPQVEELLKAMKEK